MNRLQDIPPTRFCPQCGDPWPRLESHVCTAMPTDDPEATTALLWNLISGMEVKLGDLDIASQIAAVLARPLARELTYRWDDLLTAYEGDSRD